MLILTKCKYIFVSLNLILLGLLRYFGYVESRIRIVGLTDAVCLRHEFSQKASLDAT